MELRFKYRFEAAHRFTQSTSPACMTPHGHTWYATLHIKTSGGLNQNDMSVEFQQVKSEWKSLITQVFDHSFLVNQSDPLLEALAQIHPSARLIAFPGDPTTELIALLLFNKCEAFMAHSPWKQQLTVTGITIDETPTNTIHCDRAFYLENSSKYSAYQGWWLTPQLEDRFCRNV